MKVLKLKFILRAFFALFFITYNVNATINPPFSNIIVKDSPKTYSSLKFQDIEGNLVDLKNYSDNLVILNFWATWCAPCREEMPSLDNLQTNKRITKIKIFPINIEKKNVNKSKKMQQFGKLGLKIKLPVLFRT